jgi:hypothetical protein
MHGGCCQLAGKRVCIRRVQVMKRRKIRRNVDNQQGEGRHHNGDPCSTYQDKLQRVCYLIPCWVDMYFIFFHVDASFSKIITRTLTLLIRNHRSSITDLFIVLHKSLLYARASAGMMERVSMSCLTEVESKCDIIHINLIEWSPRKQDTE